MIPDAAQRQQAVTAPGHAFVWASAGTGKTHTLTLRALYLLLTAPFDPRAKGTECARLYAADRREERMDAAHGIARRFVLTTFTRKAAAEMLTRLYAYLDCLVSARDEASLAATIAQMNGGHGDEQFRALVQLALPKAGGLARLQAGAAALAELATELQVCTLHSYAAAILRRHPIAAGLPPGAQFAEEDDTTAFDPADQLVDHWWRHVVADPKLNRQLDTLLAAVPFNDLTAWLTAIVKSPWLVAELDLPQPDRPALDELLAATEAFAARLIAARGNATNIIAAGRALAGAARNVRTGAPRAWKQFCRVLLSADGNVIGTDKKTVLKMLGELGDQRRFFENVETAYVPALQQCLATELAPLWREWREFLRAFAAWADGAVVRELNLVTFDEMVRRAVALLAGNAGVRAEERARLWALLVDEFQDTDPVQLDLLRRLLGREKKDDHDVRGFFVGDLKQSIYRFRDADLPAIEQFVAGYPQLVRVPPAAVGRFQLTTSFRSQPALTAFVNEFFERHLPLPEYAAEKLAPVRTEAGPLPEWRWLPDEMPADDSRAALARATARLIAEHAATGRYQDVLVLVKTHNELDALLPALDAAGIPAVSSGARTFHQQPEVLDALNLLIAFHNPHDTLACGALLRSPVFGLTDPEVHRLRDHIRQRRWLAPDAPWPTAARARVETFRALAAARTECALADWLRQVRAFIPDGDYARHDREGRAVARIDAVFAAFRRLMELGTVPPLAWLLDQRARVELVDRHDAALGEDVSVTDESVPAVRVMTIHKAKGLESRYVIVTGWQSVLDKPPARQKRLLRLTTKDGQPLAGFRLPWGELPIITPRFAAVQALDQELEAEERTRLAYVAATRAQDRLVLLAHRPSALTAALPTVTTGPLVPAALPAGPAAVPAALITDGAAYQRLWRARLAALAQPVPPLLHRPSQLEDNEAIEPADYIRPPTDTAREIGIVVHRYLERHLTDAAFVPIKLCALTGREEIAGPAAVILQRFFGSPNHRRVQHARILGRELPVYFADADRAWSGVIDLVFEEAGTICGVDYKASRAPADIPAEYQQQERLYTVALRRLAPDRPVAFEFWWLGAAE